MTPGHNPLKAVLVGCGGISGAWFKPLTEMPDVQLVGLVDLVADNARRRAAEFDLPNAFISTDLDRALSAQHPDIVFDCTIPGAHHATTLTALRHGCHVLGEKPLADSMVHAREMVAAAQQSGKLYAVMQNRRYMEPTRRIRSFLASDAIGPLTTVNCDFYLGPHFGGFRDQMEHVLLLDMAIHTFDQARFMSGADPVSVYCKEWNPAGSWYAHGASAVAVFEMSNGVIYTYRGSWCAEGLPTSWEAEWRFIGTRGTLKWDGAQGFAAETAAPSGGFWANRHEIPVPPYTADVRFDGHASCIQEFVECVRNGTTPNTICTDNVKSLSMVFAAIESAETGQVVQINNQPSKL
jgi:predicted dehydrogenase